MLKEQLLLEEYKALRAEISQNMSDIFRVIEFALTATAALLAVAFSQFVNDDFKWLLLFVPCLVLSPLNTIMAQRTRTTWRIGRYIETCLEPKLGYRWEAINFARKRRKKTYSSWLFKLGDLGRMTSFVTSTGGVLILIQFVCAGLAVFALLDFVAPANIQDLIDSRQFLLCALLLLLVMGAIVFQWRMLAFSNKPSEYAELDELFQFKKEQNAPEIGSSPEQK